MAYGPISSRFTAIYSGSTSTSGPWLVADMRQITVSWASSGSLGPSRFTIWGSNADGLRADDLGGSTSGAGWSLVSGVNMIGVTPGVAVVDPGLRWLRVTVPPALHSTASATTITLHGRT